MKIVKQSVELINPPKYEDVLDTIEKCGRICYKSEQKGEPERFIGTLLKRGHESVIEHEKLTFLIKTNRNMTHELVRHRVGCSYSQESTRFVNYQGKEIEFIPSFQIDYCLENEDYELENKLSESEWYYKNLIERGFTPEYARDILPGCVATTIAVTMNFRAIRHFLKLRMDKTAHPQMRELAGLVYDVVKENYPVFIEGIDK